MNRNTKITFHSFPKNNITRNLWINILGVPSHIPNSARVCSDHFSEESFDKTNPSLTRLRPNVLPLKKNEKRKEEEESFIVSSQFSTIDKGTMVSIKPSNTR